MSPRRAILHIDMDAFYASVEQRDRPELKGKPVIVGGHPTRGVVLAASYEVRPFGVRSAMPMSRAVKQAPHAIVVAPRMAAYAEASERVFAIFESVTPLIEPLSLDEAFLDVTASQTLFGSPAVIAAKLRQRILDEVRLTASAGIAPVKFVAKVASDFAKPNGQKEVLEGEVLSFLAALPVGRLWGVGPKTELQLKALGLQTVGDVAAKSPEWLVQKLGESGLQLRRLALGIDDREVIPDREAKSIGAEDTFEEDQRGTQALLPHVHSQALRVGRRLRRAGVKTRVVQLKLKFADFSVITRRVTLKEATDDGQEIYRTAAVMLEQAHEGRELRLTGVSAQELGAEAPQLALFAPAQKPRDRLNKALDKIADKFGTSAITTADLAHERELDDENEELRRKIGASRTDVRKPE